MSRLVQSRIEQVILSVHRRQQRTWLWKCVCTGAAVFAVAASAIAALRIPFGDQISWAWVAAVLIEGPVFGALYAMVNRRPLAEAALAVDREHGLKDRVQTAYGFLKSAKTSDLQQLQIRDAEKYLLTIDPKTTVPSKSPKALPYAIAFSLLAIAIIAITIPTPSAIASIEPNAAVNSIADRLDEDLQALEDFHKDSQDPELEKLLQELSVQIEALRLPNMEPKDALAKLSEMEASLQDLQQKSEKSDTSAQLQEIGEALSLSKEMASAGEALAQGKLDKAAEELAKLELPELDRKTEKAITEKLKEAQKQNNDANGNPSSKNQSLQEAAQNVSEGLSQGNRGKFKDGMKGLASESKKQSSKKKLSDLLRKQCECMCECKSECEKECNSKTTSNKAGGNKAGKSASDNESGEKTALLKPNPKMDLKGQDSGQGDSDVETEEAPEQEQQAVRAYREKATQYEAMSESVLNSESIPLGQRQTIRRYFESIRPTSGEVDEVNKKTNE